MHNFCEFHPSGTYSSRETQRWQKLEVSYGEVPTVMKSHGLIASIRMNGQSVDFKLDTGAGVTAISELTFQTLKHQVLQKPDKLLYGPSRQALGVAGKFTGELSHKSIITKQDSLCVRC